MKISAGRIQKILFIAISVCGVISPLRSIAACAGADSKVNVPNSPTTIVTSFINQTWDYLNSDKSLNSIPVSNCDGKGTLQISKIAVNYNPEDYQSQIYDSSKISGMPSSCKLDTDLNKTINTTEHFDQYKKISSYINECIGTEINSVDKIAILPLATPTCVFSFVDLQKTKAIAKGENCQIVGPKGSYVLTPVYLDSCANTDFAKGDIANVEALITVLETDTTSDVLTQKNLQLVMNADNNKALNVSKTNFRSPKFDMLRPNDYNLDIDFAQLSLLGNAKSKVTASAKYFVQNKTECKSESCLSTSSYRAPMVIENDLYLAKADNINERIFLARWYNASIVPAQWSGIDGNPGLNAIGFNWNSTQLNQNFKQAEEGDSLVLVSHLLNPNRGIKSFFTAASRVLQSRSSPSRVNLSSTSGSGSGGFGAIQGTTGLTAIASLSFQNVIPEINFESVINNHSSTNADAGKNWLVRYDQYCSQNNMSDCQEIAQLSDLVTIETEAKIIKLNDSELKVQSIETLKNSAIIQNSYDKMLTKQTQIKCLKNEISNNDLIRSKK